jgi:hypothetical protein
MPAKSKAQFRAMQAAAHGQSTLGIPASVGKEFVKATRSPGKLPKYQHSPDRYDDAQLTSEAPPRHEYHGSPENLNETETPKKAGLSRGKIQQSDGTDSPRSNNRTKSAAMPDSPEGGQQSWPGGVDSFKESSSDRP